MNLTKEEIIAKADKDLMEGKLDCMEYVNIINKYTEEEADNHIKRNPVEEREYI